MYKRTRCTLLMRSRVPSNYHLQFNPKVLGIKNISGAVKHVLYCNYRQNLLLQADNALYLLAEIEHSQKHDCISRKFRKFPFHALVRKTMYFQVVKEDFHRQVRVKFYRKLLGGSGPILGQSCHTTARKNLYLGISMTIFWTVTQKNTRVTITNTLTNVNKYRFFRSCCVTALCTKISPLARLVLL